MWFDTMPACLAKAKNVEPEDVKWWPHPGFTFSNLKKETEKTEVGFTAKVEWQDDRGANKTVWVEYECWPERFDLTKRNWR